MNVYVIYHNKRAWIATGKEANDYKTNHPRSYNAQFPSLEKAQSSIDSYLRSRQKEDNYLNGHPEKIRKWRDSCNKQIKIMMRKLPKEKQRGGVLHKLITENNYFSFKHSGGAPEYYSEALYGIAVYLNSYLSGIDNVVKIDMIMFEFCEKYSEDFSKINSYRGIVDFIHNNFSQFGHYVITELGYERIK